MISKKVSQIVEAIADGMYHASMKEKLAQLETRQGELTTLLSNVPTDMLAIAPNVVEVYSQQIASVTKALSNPPERQVATQQLRQLIEKIVIKPGTKRGQVLATLHGELGTILEWTDRQVIGNTTKIKNPAAVATGVSVSVVAGAGFEPAAFRL